MQQTISALGHRAQQIFSMANPRPPQGPNPGRSAASGAPQLPLNSRLNPLQNDRFTGSPSGRMAAKASPQRPPQASKAHLEKITEESSETTENALPVVDLADFSAKDPAKRKAFVQAMGQSLKNYGFVAVDGHGVPLALLKQYYANLKDVFDLPMNTKTQYVRTENGRIRGYYELGQEYKEVPDGSGRKVADKKENWHIGAVANVFPQEKTGTVPQLQDTAPQVYRAMESTAIQLAEAIGEFLDSEGLPDNGYLKSTMINAQGKPIGTHLLRAIHYPPVPEAERIRFQPNEPVIRAGEHDDLNLITLLPESIEPGLEILRRKNGENDHWMPVHSQNGYLICNAGKMLSIISGGEYGPDGEISQQGLLPSIRHRVIGNADTLDKSRYSTPFFATPHYDKPLKNLRTGQSLPTGEFVFRRLKEHGSIPASDDQTYEAFRKKIAPMIIAEPDADSTTPNKSSTHD